MDAYYSAVAGGIVIGLSSVYLFSTTGMVLGINGKVQQSFFLSGSKGKAFSVISGLLSSALLMKLAFPNKISVITYQIQSSDLSHLIVGGLLIGFGMTLANGCGIGHACGASRLNRNSLLSLAVMVAAGVTALYILSLINQY